MIQITLCVFVAGYDGLINLMLLLYLGKQKLGRYGDSLYAVQCPSSVR